LTNHLFARRAKRKDVSKERITNIAIEPGFNTLICSNLESLISDLKVKSKEIGTVLRRPDFHICKAISFIFGAEN
jgi:hypothetical protein